MPLFISHSTKDDDFVNRLVSELQIHGHQTWVDHIDMPPGAQWMDVIEEALEHCELLILVVSQSAMESDYVKREWQIFYDLKRPIIPIRLEDCRTPLLLRTLHHVEYNRVGDMETLTKKLLPVLPQSKAKIAEHNPAMAALDTIDPNETRAANRTSNITSSTEKVFIGKVREAARQMEKTDRLQLQDNEIKILIPSVKAALVCPLKKPIIIGRKHEETKTYPDIDLSVYPGGETVSRRHAMIAMTSDGVRIVDLWSSNGTYVGRTRLTPKISHRLKDGDIIRFGRKFAVQIRFIETEPELVISTDDGTVVD